MHAHDGGGFEAEGPAAVAALAEAVEGSPALKAEVDGPQAGVVVPKPVPEPAAVVDDLGGGGGGIGQSAGRSA